MWWRQRFAALRSELKALQDGVAQKQTRLVELRRERRIYTRARDREAVNLLTDEISADEVRINQVMKQIDELEQDATRAAVPMEWRR
jgi:predicted  nucleic acid-binding Zn-ribbon protein